MSAEDLEGRARLRALQGRRRRRHPLAHAARRRTRARAAYFTRGTTRDAQARYSEVGQRLRLQRAAPAEEVRHRGDARAATRAARRGAPRRRAQGVIYFGSTSPAMREALDTLDRERHRARRAAAARVSVPGVGAPSSSPRTTTVFVVEQNRDAQMRTLLVNELDIDPARLIAGAALRRHADHGALHHRAITAEGLRLAMSRASPSAARAGRSSA